MFEEPSADYTDFADFFYEETPIKPFWRICVIGVICGYYFCGRFAQP